MCPINRSLRKLRRVWRKIFPPIMELYANLGGFLQYKVVVEQRRIRRSVNGGVPWWATFVTTPGIQLYRTNAKYTSRRRVSLERGTN